MSFQRVKHKFEMKKRDGEDVEKKENLVLGKKKNLRQGMGFLLYLAVLCCLTFAVIHFVGQRTVVIGPSMQPTLYEGDNLIVDKMTYRFRLPKRFEIIVFPYPTEEDRLLIKRIIGLPGERVRIAEDGTIYINGEELIESYGKEVIKNAGLAAQEIVLSDDEYFVLGDNRNDSTDSRSASVGCVKRESIVGRAWLRIFPFDKIRLLNPEKE